MRPPSVCSLFHFQCPVYSTLDNRQIGFGAKLQLVADPLPLFAFFPHNFWVKVAFHGESANLNQLDHHRQAWNRTLILDISEIPPLNTDHFRQSLSCQTLCFPRSFYIRAESFKAGAIFNFCHITSPSYIV